MREGIREMCRRRSGRSVFLFAGIATIMLSSPVFAQDTVVHFRMAAAPSNIQGCIRMDPSFTRVHTLTVNGDDVRLKSAGGINDKMKPVKPGVWATTFQAQGGHIDIVADSTTTPKSLTIATKSGGCKWTGQPE